jgi:hypothetical protein
LNVQQKLPIILSSAALFVAILGATPAGQAAAHLVVPSNSVGTLQLRAGSVTDSKIRKHSLTAADFQIGQLPAGQQGPQGQQGQPGAQGVPGTQGAPGLSGYEIVVGNGTAVAPNGTGYDMASCPAGKKAIGGGFAPYGGGKPVLGGPRVVQLAMAFSAPVDSASGSTWWVGVYNLSGTATQVWAYAVCASVAS